jgi:sterol 3beta-glucosyltransferase
LKRIALVTIGTQGDVQPYLALALALQDRGYSAVLGATEEFQEMVESYGIEFHTLGPSMQSFLTERRFENAMSSSMLINGPSLLRKGQQIADTAARHAWHMCQGADAIVLNMNTSFGIDIAEALKVPAIMTALQPLNSTSEFPISMYYVADDLGPALNKLSYTAANMQQAYWNLPRNKLRRELMGLDARTMGGIFTNTDGSPLTTLYAYSDAVSPRPRDWPRTAIVTGYWSMRDRSGWGPSDAFKAFLSAGEAPVYIGFGSMPFGAERNTRILREAMEKWGGRAVVARGWGGIDPSDLPSTVFAIDKAPHDRIFRYVRAVVHHGGAGTTSAGLHLGRPTFVVPQAMDQPYWGRRVWELGCGPKPVRLRKLTAEILAGALEDLTRNDDYRINAAAIADTLRAEDGTGKAIDVIEKMMAGYVPRSVKARRTRKPPRPRRPLLKVVG